MAEVVHAIVLLAHFHSLSSFVFSCGLTQNTDSSHKTNICLDDSNNVIDEQHKKQSTTPQFFQKIILEQQADESNENKLCPGQITSNSSGVLDLMKRMQDLSTRKINCSDAELTNRFKNVEMQVSH